MYSSLLWPCACTVIVDNNVITETILLAHMYLSPAVFFFYLLRPLW